MADHDYNDKNYWAQRGLYWDTNHFTEAHRLIEKVRLVHSAVNFTPIVPPGTFSPEQEAALRTFVISVLLNPTVADALYWIGKFTGEEGSKETRHLYLTRTFRMAKETDHDAD